MGEQTKNMLIGVFIIGACSLIVFVIMFLKPGVGDDKQTLYVRFSNINNIHVGTLVMFAGKPVGEVVSIEEIANPRSQPTDELGRVYFYQLTLHIDSHVKVYNTDQISLQTSGLLGEKSIAIIPKAPPAGVTPKLVSTEPLYAESIDPIESAFNELRNLGSVMEGTFKRVSTWMDKNGQTVADSIKSFGDVMDEAKVTISDINREQVVHNANEGIKSFTSTMDQMSCAMKEMHDGKVFTNVSTVIDNFKSASANINTITADVADGKGTLGKLITNEDMYLNFKAILSKVNTLMNDVNHYGILFHLNKSWQRTRLQEMNTLNALNTPQGFKSYFESEVDEINMAMSRLSMLIEKAEQSPDRETILNNEGFKKDFAELLRRSEDLSDNLRLYNEQLLDADTEGDDD